MAPLSGSFPFERLSNAGSDPADILRQASDSFPVVRFVLNAIEACENGLKRARAANLRGKPCDGIEANRGRVFAQVGHGDFNAIGKARKGDFQLRMICRQMFEGFRAGSDDGGLQSSDGVVFKSRDIGEIPDHASGGGRQARVRIDLQVQTSEFSGHGYWPERLRRLPGNRGNSRGRLCKDARLAGPYRWCSTFRRCNDLPASRIAHKRSDLA